MQTINTINHGNRLTAHLNARPKKPHVQSYYLIHRISWKMGKFQAKCHGCDIINYNH